MISRIDNDMIKIMTIIMKMFLGITMMIELKTLIIMILIMLYHIDNNDIDNVVSTTLMKTWYIPNDCHKYH